MQVMDNAKVSIVELFLPSEWFNEYNCEIDVTIGINSNIGVAAFFVSSSVIPVLTIGSGSTLEYQSFGSHTYSSFSLGNNLIFDSKVASENCPKVLPLPIVKLVIVLDKLLS